MFAVSKRAKTHFTVLFFKSLMNEVVHTSPTIGSNVEEIVVKNTHFLMWDIGGQESLRSSWNTYYSNTEVRGTEVLSSSHFLPECGSWCVCSEHRRRWGPPKSEVTLSQCGLSEKQSWGQPVQYFGEGRGRTREARQRQMCGRSLKRLHTEQFSWSIHMSFVHKTCTWHGMFSQGLICIWPFILHNRSHVTGPHPLTQDLTPQLLLHKAPHTHTHIHTFTKQKTWVSS